VSPSHTAGGPAYSTIALVGALSKLRLDGDVSRLRNGRVTISGKIVGYFGGLVHGVPKCDTAPR
jgi:hypothetical protein